MENPIKINQFFDLSNAENINSPYYSILVIDGKISFSIDDVFYECEGKNIVFLSPYQMLSWEKVQLKTLNLLQFHGDFYCIEYHKKEVACNGILFNNIYSNPFVAIDGLLFEELENLIDKIKVLECLKESYNASIVKSYLQLILALSSKEKQINQVNFLDNKMPVNEMISFKDVLETNFIKEKSVAFYADYYALSVDAFSKKIKKFYGKSPSALIQERMTLEAKKQLHLTYKHIKEIANDLGFADEFYFSRYFKKHVGVSPKIFRDKVGISIVAK